MPIDFNFMVGGEAGQGVQSVGFLLAKVLPAADIIYSLTRITSQE